MVTEEACLIYTVSKCWFILSVFDIRKPFSPHLCNGQHVPLQWCGKKGKKIERQLKRRQFHIQLSSILNLSQSIAVAATNQSQKTLESHCPTKKELYQHSRDVSSAEHTFCWGWLSQVPWESTYPWVPSVCVILWSKFKPSEIKAPQTSTPKKDNSTSNRLPSIFSLVWLQ